MSNLATKAQLTTQLKKAGIPIPASAKVADMEHRLKHWIGGEGFLVRLLRQPSDKFIHNPVTLLNDKSKLYWIPNSDMGRRIVGSRLVLVLGRTNKPSNDATILDVPSDYDRRWNSGGDNSTDS